ncbi:hypothetical protein J3R83DRAFT_13219 [Lanmaoa asiatica]|nr:hypothetical protein J3R83DRAFT_13219 [Lanmaoa asiatica]
MQEPASSSSPSTRTSIRSDIDIDIDVNVDSVDIMGDDEEEHERAPVSKRKAPVDETSSARGKPHKMPRLDLRGASSSSASSSGDAGHYASRTQPPAPSSTQKNGVRGFTQECVGAPRVESSASGNSGTSSSSSGFSKMLSQTVRKVIARDKERERRKGKEKTREQVDRATSSGRGPSVTARKQTTQVKNIHKVTTANLLKQAQNSNDPRNESTAATRIRPRWKQKRTNYDEEMARARPLDMARHRGDGMIELTDSSDSARRPRPSQPSATTGPRRVNASVNKDDPIIITSGSEDDRPTAIRPTQRRRSGPGGTHGKGANRPQVLPPVDADVISISDSEEDLGARNIGVCVCLRGRHQRHQKRQFPFLNLRLHRLLRSYPSIQLRDSKIHNLQDTQVPPRPSPSPSYGPPPDDFDDPFNNIDFGTAGDKRQLG